MQSSSYRILHILTNIPAQEWKLFHKYIQKMYAAGTDLANLSEQLYKNKKTITTDLGVESIKQKHFTKLTDKGFANLMSKLNLEFENWVVAYDLQNSKYDKSLALIKAYNKRAIYSEADRSARKLESRISENEKFDLEKTRASYLMNDYQYYSDNPIKYRKGYQLLLDVSQTLNNYYKSMSHVYNAEMHNWGRLKNYDYSEIISKNNNRIQDIPLQETSELVAVLESLMANYSLDCYHFLKEKLLNDEIDRGGILNSICCSYAAHSCTKFIREKKILDRNELAKIYNYGLSSKGLLNNGKLPVIRFHNIITSLANILSYLEVESFIDKWINIVDTKYPMSVKHIAQAQNCFYHERYADILPHCRLSKFENVGQKNTALRFEIVSLYESEDYDLLYTALSNYNRFINRNKSKLSKQSIAISKNFFRAICHLSNKELDALDLLCNSSQPLLFRPWLSKKISR